MKRRGVLPLAGVLVLAASLAQAQTSTADGVAAFLQGDHARAAEILKPIAESWSASDKVAAFFMAALYENGHGVPADPIRACALYLHALDPTSPLGRLADALMQALQRSLSPQEFQDCDLLAVAGFDHAFRPVTFALEQGHSIALDLGGATITYEGKETRLDLGLATRSVIFLPVEHTELLVGRPLSMRRHFIEFFMWIPSHPQTWTLHWRAFEVVRNEMIPVISEDLITISAERPPGGPIDIRAMASLGVNHSGETEWAVLTGPNQRREIIESDAERRESGEQVHARAAADARVDWTRVRNTRRTPTLRYSDASGCGNMFLHAWSDDRVEGITIRANADSLGLSTARRTFDLASPRSDLEVLVQVYERPVRSWPFCTDVRSPEGPQESWTATGGTVTIELSPPGVRAREPWLYRATIQIVGAEFVSPAGVRVKQRQPMTLTAIVGSMGAG